MSRDILIESQFSNIGSDYKIRSDIANYNCIAFAADDYTKYWWPGKFYWPDGVPENEDLDSFIACYKSLGYVECAMNRSFENGYEKIAIYMDPNNTPTHAAKQIHDEIGIWKSKLSWYHDIEHKLEGLIGWPPNSKGYGNIACILKRKVNSFKK
jgi:hypothetical protein